MCTRVSGMCMLLCPSNIQHVETRQKLKYHIGIWLHKAMFHCFEIKINKVKTRNGFTKELFKDLHMGVLSTVSL